MENFDLEFNIEEVVEISVESDDNKQLDPTRLSKSRRAWCC
ncbi:MAG: hypothetical protein WAQ98_23080 [Blastocatellia bacterium]